MYKMQNFNLLDMLASFIMTGKCRVLIWLSHLPLFMPCDGTPYSFLFGSLYVSINLLAYHLFSVLCSILQTTMISARNNSSKEELR